MSKMRVLWFVMAVLAGIAFAGSNATAALQPIELAGTRPESGGFGGSPKNTIGIAGVVFKGYICGVSHSFGTWKVPNGYTLFEGYFGLKDSLYGAKEGSASISINGDIVKTVNVSKGQKAVQISIPVNSGQSLRIDLDQCYLGEPRLLAKAIAQASSIDTASMTNSAYVLETAPQFNASLAVDPRTCAELIKTLATKMLGDSAQTKPTTKKIAVAKFKLIAIDDQHKLPNTVAENVREDISTSLVDYNWLQVVERGQLDKAIESLKLDQSGLIDSDTAKKLGKMVSADLVLLGSVSDRGNFAVLNARVIEVETGQVKYSASQEMRK